jgi:DNA-directed RNA polymerase subunit delta
MSCDLPKSKGKKATGGKKKEEEEEDFKVDEDFKEFDRFNDKSGGCDDDEDDDF